MPTPESLLEGRYQLERVLGEGGMGEVWSAVDTRLRTPVAVKLLKVAGGMGPEQARMERRRLIREARAAAAVRHPGIVRILDAVDGDQAAFLVMELLEGASLRQHIERGPLDLRTTCALMLQVASAMQAAHLNGVVHRDLKPENIFLATPAADQGEPTVKVLDFGIAKVVRRADATTTPSITPNGDVVGSPPYMSPEQTFGEEDIDHRTDLWSFGIVFYECLSGILPTRAPNTGQIFKIITKLGIKPIERVVPQIPADIADLLGRLLAQEREERPADIGAAIRVLERFATAPRSTTSMPAALESLPRQPVAIRCPAPVRGPRRRVRRPQEPEQGIRMTLPLMLALSGVVVPTIVLILALGHRTAAPVQTTSSVAASLSPGPPRRLTYLTTQTRLPRGSPQHEPRRSPEPTASALAKTDVEAATSRRRSTTLAAAPGGAGSFDASNRGGGKADPRTATLDLTFTPEPDGSQGQGSAGEARTGDVAPTPPLGYAPNPYGDGSAATAGVDLVIWSPPGMDGSVRAAISTPTPSGGRSSSPADPQDWVCGSSLRERAKRAFAGGLNAARARSHHRSLALFHQANTLCPTRAAQWNLMRAREHAAPPRIGKRTGS